MVLKNIVLFICVIFLASCQVIPTEDNTHFRSARVGLGATTLEHGDQFTDEEPAPTVELGVLYKVRDDDEAKQEDPNHYTGFVSDMSVDYTRGDDRFAGFKLRTDRISISTGGRYYFDTGSRYLQPYLGGGGVVQYGRFDVEPTGETEDNFAFGGYGQVGLESALNDDMRLGLSYKQTFGLEYDLGDTDDIEFDAGTLMLSFGWSF